MSRQGVYSMTEGNPVKLLLKFTVPMLIGNLFQQLYNMVDSIIVGQFVGANALAAVGATSALIFLFFSMCFGMSAGVGIVVSQFFGAGDAFYAFINGLLEIAGRVGFAEPLTSIPAIGMWGIFLTTGLTWFLTGTISMMRYGKGKWAAPILQQEKEE